MIAKKKTIKQTRILEVWHNDNKENINNVINKYITEPITYPKKHAIQIFFSFSVISKKYFLINGCILQYK